MQARLHGAGHPHVAALRVVLLAFARWRRQLRFLGRQLLLGGLAEQLCPLKGLRPWGVSAAVPATESAATAAHASGAGQGGQTGGHPGRLHVAFRNCAALRRRLSALSHNMLPQVAQILHAHRLGEKVHCAMRDTSQHC